MLMLYQEAKVPQLSNFAFTEIFMNCDETLVFYFSDHLQETNNTSTEIDYKT